MSSKYIIAVIIVIMMLSCCSIFDKPVYEFEADVAYNDMDVDSDLIEEAGLYEFRFYSDARLDVMFFSMREGMTLFADSGLLYSEALFYPLFRESTDYFYEQAFIYDDARTLYFIVDNTGYLSGPVSSASYDIEIYKQEE